MAVYDLNEQLHSIALHKKVLSYSMRMETMKLVEMLMSSYRRRNSARGLVTEGLLKVRKLSFDVEACALQQAGNSNAYNKISKASLAVVLRLCVAETRTDRSHLRTTDQCRAV